MNIGTIQGGTNAGWRKVRPSPPAPWDCLECGVTQNATHFTRCPNCGSHWARHE